MITFDDVKIFSQLPIVNLEELDVIEDGFFINVPDICKNNFKRNSLCKKHYEDMLYNKSSFIMCPQGFSSYNIEHHNIYYAFTSFIPFPRHGLQIENQMGKKYSDNKISRDNVLVISQVLNKIIDNLSDKENLIIREQAKALHEIRKMNGILKITAEKLHNNNPSDPDLLKIYKTSELLTKQFEIIELLANENLLRLPLKANSNLHSLIYKCVKIYQNNNILKLINVNNYDPYVMVCDKTFSIIPTVLIENALKYAVKNTPIVIEIYKINGATEDNIKCTIKVTNEISKSIEMDDSVFRKGTRVDSTKDGSGIGLYLAQLVAKQHNTIISVTTFKDSNKYKCSFSFTLPISNIQ